MLFEAFFWDNKVSRPKPNVFFKNADFDKLLANWGRSGDKAIIAEEGQTPVGAAWFRLWTQADHFYGFVAPDIPELGMALLPAYRSQGIGRMLLEKLIRLALEDGFTALSLSVDPANYARRLYESLGFIHIGESGTSWTYKLEI